MSNVNMNNTDANRADQGQGNIYGADKLRVNGNRRSKSNDVEIAYDFDVHSEKDQTTFSTEQISKPFRPNEGPVSERTAWN